MSRVVLSKVGLTVLALVKFGHTDCALVLSWLIWVKLILCLATCAVKLLHWSHEAILFLCLILYEHIITRARIHYTRVTRLIVLLL